MGNDKHIFVSYSRQDGDFALKIGQDLRAANVDIWLDQLDISPGSRWDREVDNALRTCGRLLLILSPDSASSENVMDEVAVAMHENKPVVPVLYRPCSIPLRLMRLQHIDFTQSYEEGLNKLLDYLGGLGQDDLARAREFKVKIPRPQSEKTFINEKLSFHPFTLTKKTANSWQLLVIYAAGVLAFTLIVFILIKNFDSHPTNTSQLTASQSRLAPKDSLRTSIPSTDRDTPIQPKVPLGQAPDLGGFALYVCKLNPRGDNYLSLRSGPGTSYTEILRMDPNTSLRLLSKQEPWFYVQLQDGTNGWVHSQWICWR